MSATARSVAGVLAGTAVLALTGCGGGETGDPPEDLQGRLDMAKQSLDEAASVAFSMSTESLPSGVSGLLDADGVGTHIPAFEGEGHVVTGGATLPIDLVSVAGEVYAKVGFVPTYFPIDPGSYGAPDPAALLDPDTGVSTFLTSTEAVAGGEPSREGEEVLTTISGTLAGQTVQTLIPSADSAADFAVEYGLTDDDELRSAVVTGPFYPGSDDVTYTLSLDPSDQVVKITAPT